MTRNNRPGETPIEVLMNACAIVIIIITVGAGVILFGLGMHR